MNEPIREEEMEPTNRNQNLRDWYKFDKIGPEEKQGLVNNVFDSVANHYDLMNDLMSGGMHRFWKDALVAWLSPPTTKNVNWKVLDVAGGTGDITLRLLDRSRGRIDATVCDINESMLQAGIMKSVNSEFSDKIQFVAANAEDLPLPDNKFDAYTIAFGIRNIPRIDKALSEAFRVLKIGGRFLCLEFSTVEVPLLDRLYDIYSLNVIPQLGKVVTGDRDSYRYLVESIRKFPNQEKFGDRIGMAGFKRVEYRNLSGGIAAIHSAWKI